tara:strand:+ start:261 stop:1391 length:1131 start_codon:yes stop_codon:yes gene_type:complete
LKVQTKTIIPFVVVILFLLPPTLVSFIPIELRSLYYFTTIGLCWIISFFFFFRPIFLKKDHSMATFFTLIMIISGSITFMIKGQLNLFNIIFPMMSLVGYKILLHEKINVKYPMNILFLFFYILFYVKYYSIIPDFFYRPDFNEDFLVASSSNAIPISLNTTLYAYMILNYLYKDGAEKSILIISIINLLLNYIQQGRGGILVGTILLFLALYNYAPNQIRKLKYASIFIGFLIIIQLFIFVSSSPLFNSGVTIEDYSVLQESRIIAQIQFFQQLTLDNFFFGYKEGTLFVANGELLKYTFNTFLDFWNNYNLLSLFILFYLIIYRFIKRDIFYFPIFYLIPFLIYTNIESIYLPSFIDVFIYLVLFVKRDLIIES